MDTASLFCNSSSNLILKLAFLLLKSKSDIAASILSPPTNLAGLASEEFIAMFDFFIIKSSSHPSGFTINLFESDDITFTVTLSFIFLSLNHSKGSLPVCLRPTLTLFSSFLISRILTLSLVPFLYFFISSSGFPKYDRSLACKKPSISNPSIETYIAY